ncbi:MAG: GNAT family N-acetyltransferase, partial [Acidimicrobiia bacterium]|nr:GNAT family N-acetyltransferase [Acidimicrobiia bacterium]
PGARDEEPFAIVARREGTVAGVATGWTHGGVGHLRELIVAVEDRGLGIGGKLLAAFESLAVERGATRLALRTYRNQAAHAFYRAHGWVDEVSWDWKHGREFVQMRRDL